MTKFGDDMVKFIDLGLRRLDSLTVVLQYETVYEQHLIMNSQRVLILTVILKNHQEIALSAGDIAWLQSTCLTYMGSIRTRKKINGLTSDFQFQLSLTKAIFYGLKNNNNRNYIWLYRLVNSQGPYFILEKYYIH